MSLNYYSIIKCMIVHSFFTPRREYEFTPPCDPHLSRRKKGGGGTIHHQWYYLRQKKLGESTQREEMSGTKIEQRKINHSRREEGACPRRLEQHIKKSNEHCGSKIWNFQKGLNRRQ